MQCQFRLEQGAAWIALACALCIGSAHAQEASDLSPEQEGVLEVGQVPVPGPPDSVTLPEVEPIIPDEEFNESIPEFESGLDGELDRPLESIEQFERRLELEASAQDAQLSPVPHVLADGDLVKEIGDAPIRDAELTNPLPPIEAFEVTPVEFADGPQTSEAVKVAYAVEVTGLDLANSESEINLRGRFRELSALEGGGSADNSAMISARLEEDAALMETILASEGWYTPIITTRIEQPASGDGASLLAVIDVDSGKRYNFSEIVINARPTAPPGLIRDNLPLKIGEPIIAERVQGAEANVSVALARHGYPFVETGNRDILLDPDLGEGIYTLPVDTGPRARFGKFATEGDLAFDAGHIDVLARFDQGDLYDSRKVDDLRKALVATGLFSTVSVEPLETGELARQDSEYVTMLVKQYAGPPRTIAGTAGYGTGEGFSLEASWTHRNMFPPEGALIAHGIMGTKEQGAGATFRRSNAGKRDRTFELVAEALHSEFSAFSTYTGRLAGRISYDSTPIWQKRFTYSFGAELLAAAEKDFDFDTGTRNRKTYFIGGLNGQLGIDYTDDLLDPTTGFKLTALVQPEGSINDGFNPYVRARIDGSAYFSVSDSLVLAGRVRVGTIQGVERDEIAPSRRLYAGGGGSVRGYGYQELGQLDPNGDPIGGRSLSEAAAEVRYRFGNFGLVGFVDVGQSYADTMPQFSDLRFGAGIGGRYYTNFGPLRVDIATPVNRRPGESRINVYISIGQAF